MRFFFFFLIIVQVQVMIQWRVDRKEGDGFGWGRRWDGGNWEGETVMGQRGTGQERIIYTNKTGDCLFICSPMDGQTAKPNGLKFGG